MSNPDASATHTTFPCVCGGLAEPSLMYKEGGL
jgi:hypothetical protein